VTTVPRIARILILLVAVAVFVGPVVLGLGHLVRSPWGMALVNSLVIAIAFTALSTTVPGARERGGPASRSHLRRYVHCCSAGLGRSALLAALPDHAPRHLVLFATGRFWVFYGSD
jgi:hypothetical protein